MNYIKTILEEERGRALRANKRARTMLKNSKERLRRVNAAMDELKMIGGER